ncbi:hypothetical protein PTTG_07382 [Puccinia triticina 1-1 BBBD Race 1]|uniref:Uncharacterized protein n=1 Tax=Puccinia triticina (isolate 1-1 / race 1 (BBBD)) TaxID=630390 RepID=A0A0C4F2R1_PUCT1|nr:hypothetical protein PTTG_07382 [Puccinia triticina 1-1 BBBD Race 1]
MSRGYWGGHHYWGKVLRKVCGVTGVWLHNDWVNGGYAQMVDPVPGSISGAHPHTSWLIYSRAWTDEEAAFVDEIIQRIRQDNPKITATFPFTHMKTFLNISYNGEVTVDSLNPPSSPKKKLIRATSINYLGSKISDKSDSEESSVSSSKSSVPNHEDTSEHGASDESEDKHADTPTSPPSQPIKIRLRLNKTQKTQTSPPLPTGQAVKSHPSAPKKLNTNAMLPARRGRSSKVPAVDANTSLSHPKEPIKVPRDDAAAPLLPTQTVTSVK